MSTTDKNKQRVLCVPASTLHPYGALEGFMVDKYDFIGHALQCITDANGVLIERGHCETDPLYKQIIPQIFITSPRGIAIHHIPGTAGEKRLVGACTIYFGGHMDPEDGTDIHKGARRELIEETGISGPYDLRRVGFVNRNDSAVSEVHFGVVYHVHVQNEDQLPNTNKDDGVSGTKFYTWEEAAQMVSSMTSWSAASFQLVRDYFRQ